MAELQRVLEKNSISLFADEKYNGTSVDAVLYARHHVLQHLHVLWPECQEHGSGCAPALHGALDGILLERRISDGQRVGDERFEDGVEEGLAVAAALVVVREEGLDFSARRQELKRSAARFEAPQQQCSSAAAQLPAQHAAQQKEAW